MRKSLKSKTSALLTLFFFVCGIASAQTTSPKTPATRTSGAPATPQGVQRRADLPTTEEVEASMKRSFGYDPGVTWQILDIKESNIPGLAEVLVSMNKQQPVHLYLAPGAQTAI